MYLYQDHNPRDRVFENNNFEFWESLFQTNKKQTKLSNYLNYKMLRQQSDFCQNLAQIEPAAKF